MLSRMQRGEPLLAKQKNGNENEKKTDFIIFESIS
jgi:hypothetical protein